ncbi:MAG TPA: septum formation initiator family protein [Candidatus Babeliales bacterium]|jgi:cell division protein FtsB|nr:septum formation initiator family protein [Candidatus Babeliales bacterium]
MAKSIIYSCIVLTQIAFFCYVSIYGKKGWLALAKLKQDIHVITFNKEKKEEQIQELKQLITRSTDSFYKEKIAREQLQMARPGDQIYYLVKN